MNAERPTILALAGVPDTLLARIAERYEVVDGRDREVLAQPAAVLSRVRGVACAGRARSSSIPAAANSV